MRNSGLQTPTAYAQMASQTPGCHAQNTLVSTLDDIMINNVCIHTIRTAVATADACIKMQQQLQADS